MHERTVWAVELANNLRFSRETLVESGLTGEQIEVLRADIAREPRWEWSSAPPAEDPNGRVADWHRWDGFELTRVSWPAGDRKVGFTIPYRILIFGTGLLPAWVVSRGIRRRRPRKQGPPRRLGVSFAIAATLSLALFLVVSAAWIQSEIRGAIVERMTDVSTGGFPLFSVASWVSMPGSCHLQWTHAAPHPGVAEGDTVSWCAPEVDYFSTERWAFSGFAKKRWVGLHGAGLGWSVQGRAWAAELVAPYWLLWLLTACLPALWLAVRRGWVLRRPPGVCGYDLRASIGRCPECGEAIRTDESPRGTGVSPVHGAP